jgi:hypothetical protein
MEEHEASHGRDSHRPGQRHSQERGAQIDLANVDEDILADGEPIHGAAITADGGLALRAAVTEVPHVSGQNLLRVLPDFRQGDEFVGHGPVR